MTSRSSRMVMRRLCFHGEGRCGGRSKVSWQSDENEPQTAMRGHEVDVTDLLRLAWIADTKGLKVAPHNATQHNVPCRLSRTFAR